MNSVLTFNIEKMAATHDSSSRSLGLRKRYRLMQQYLEQPHNWRIFGENLRDILIRMKPSFAKAYFEAINRSRNSEGKIDTERALMECKKTDETFDYIISSISKNLFKSTISKIIENSVLATDESEEKGDDPPKIKIPQTFLEPGLEINIASDDESDSSTTGGKMTPAEQEKQELINIYAMAVKGKMENILEHEINSQLTKPLTTMFSKYIESSNLNTEEFPEFSKYLEENTDSKYSIEEKKKQVLAFQSMPFIVHDLQEIVRNSYNENPKEELLSKIILHGHALSDKTMIDLVHVFYRLFKKYVPELQGLRVILQTNRENVTYSSPSKIQK